MCMADGADSPDVWRQWERRARKPHKCDECGRQIAKDERYLYAEAHDTEVGWWSTKRCSHCCVLAAWLREECGRYLVHGVLDDFREHAEEYQRFDLWRLTWGARNKWNRKGALLPVPKVPLTSVERARVPA